MKNTEDDEIDLLELLFLLLKHAFAIILTSIICGGIALAYTTFMITPMYSATADMYVNNYVETKDLSYVSSSDIYASTELVSTYSVILKSHTVLEEVINNLNLSYDYTTLNKMVSLNAVDQTQVMRITVKDASAQEALEITKELVRIAPNAIMSVVDVGSVTISDQPYTTGEKVSPSRTKNTLIGAAAGFVLSCGVVLLSMLMNTTFTNEQVVRETLGVPVLAVIPKENAVRSKKKSKSKSKSKGESK